MEKDLQLVKLRKERISLLTNQNEKLESEKEEITQELVEVKHLLNKKRKFIKTLGLRVLTLRENLQAEKDELNIFSLKTEELKESIEEKTVFLTKINTSKKITLLKLENLKNETSKLEKKNQQRELAITTAENNIVRQEDLISNREIKCKKKEIAQEDLEIGLALREDEITKREKRVKIKEKLYKLKKK